MNPTNSITIREEVPTFIKKKHELDSLYKRIEGGSKKAVALLIEIMEDSKQDIKIRKECAKDLVTLQTTIADQINKDNMNRLIAEIKVKPGGAATQLTTDEEIKPPFLDFNNIREVN